MADTETPKDGIRSLIHRFRTSEHWAVSLARDILWMICVVGGIALALYLVCGTWPAVVTIESGSMTPHMNIGDLVVVVQKDRFGDLQTWDGGRNTSYQKFGDYGDVIIYRPNGVTDFWASIGVLPLSKQHPIIHRAMTWVDAGEEVPSYLNPYRGSVTPADYIPLATTSATQSGYYILYPANGTPPGNISSLSTGMSLKTSEGSYFLPSEYVVPGDGYVRALNTTTSHGGYITKGDNNPTSDQGSLLIDGMGTIEPVQKDWVVGKALFTIPYVGLLPLHIWEVAIVLIIIMVLYEWFQRRREGEAAADSAKPKKGKKKQKK